MPQGSVLGPLLFLIYINDITQNIKSDCLLYADDTSLFDVVEDPALSFSKLSNDLNSIEEWALKWLVTINPSKTKCMTFSTSGFNIWIEWHENCFPETSICFHRIFDTFFTCYQLLTIINGDTISLFTIPLCPSSLLNVVYYGPCWTIMNNILDVMEIHSHAESRGGNHNPDISRVTFK